MNESIAQNNIWTFAEQMTTLACEWYVSFRTVHLIVIEISQFVFKTRY